MYSRTALRSQPGSEHQQPGEIGLDSTIEVDGGYHVTISR